MPSQMKRLRLKLTEKNLLPGHFQNCRFFINKVDHDPDHLRKQDELYQSSWLLFFIVGSRNKF